MTGNRYILDNRYMIIEEIGRGGMSVVYLAVDVRLNKKWAVKEISAGNSYGTNMEAEVLKNLDHPTLPRIVDIIYADRNTYIVMDYVEGRPLNEIIKNKGKISQENVVKWAESLCEALMYLHNMNPPIIYRDMKPSNIMLKADGNVKLIDFGTAVNKNVVKNADSFGTRGYAAPEQLTAGEIPNRVDTRTDIYSLGATIYTMLTGKLPEIRGNTSKSIREEDKSLSAELDKIVQKCMEINPDDRYQSCEELIYHLRNYKSTKKTLAESCKKKVYGAVAVFMLIVCFSITAVSRHRYVIKSRNDKYEKLLEQGFSYIKNNDTEDAVKTYMEAITNVDGSRAESYLELLKIYKNYYDEPEKGLSQVTYYIDQNYEGIDENIELLMQVGMDYFELAKDYEKSAYYFGLIDSNKCPEAEMYKTIALSMCKLDVNYNVLSNTLTKLEWLADNKNVSYGELQVYELLCDVYVKSGNKLKNAERKIVEIADKGLLALDEYEDDNIKAHYYITFNQYLITGLETIGDEVTSDKNYYYERALECCGVIIEMVSKNDNLVMGTNKAKEYRRTKLCKKAELLAKLSKIDDAFKVYTDAEKEYGTDSLEIFVGHLSLLCSIEEQRSSDVESWNYETLYEVYKKGCSVPGIEEDYRWKRLMVKLQPLFEKNEEERR